MDKSKLSDEEWIHLISKLKKTPGIRVGCETESPRVSWRPVGLSQADTAA